MTHSSEKLQLLGWSCKKRGESISLLADSSVLASNSSPNLWRDSYVFSKLPHPIQAGQFLPEWCHNLWSLLASFFKQGSPTSGPWTGASCQLTGNIRLEIKCTTNVMQLSYPQTIPSHSAHGKTVFQQTCPWSQKGWELMQRIWTSRSNSNWELLGFATGSVVKNLPANAGNISLIPQIKDMSSIWEDPRCHKIIKSACHNH